MKTLNNTVEILKKYKPILKTKYGVKEIGIFGSYARGDANKKSDIDILVNFSQPIGLEFIGLEDYLKKVLKKKVDLVSKKALKHYIGEHILREVIYL